jgi:hypothetical protein
LAAIGPKLACFFIFNSISDFCVFVSKNLFASLKELFVPSVNLAFVFDAFGGFLFFTLFAFVCTALQDSAGLGKAARQQRHFALDRGAFVKQALISCALRTLSCSPH